MNYIQIIAVFLAVSSLGMLGYVSITSYFATKKINRHLKNFQSNNSKLFLNVYVSCSSISLIIFYFFQKNFCYNKFDSYICTPNLNGSIAQLVQSICFTRRGSAVRTRVLPQKTPCNFARCFYFVDDVQSLHFIFLHQKQVLHWLYWR